MKMKNITVGILFAFLVPLLSIDVVVYAGQTVAITYDAANPMHAFGVRDLERSLEATGNQVVGENADLGIVISQFEPGMGPQSFRIQREGSRGIRIVAGDSVGAMYGALELAEQISLGGGLDAVQDKARKPYILRRGLKFNIPLDARAPSYDDTGTSAHENIPVMWEWEFWHEFLNSMVRNRYNVLTLWTTHPYPGLVKLPEYPEANYDDVHVLRKPVDEKGDRHWDKLDLFDPANTKVVKQISLDEKIAFWQKVFTYAEDHGIEIDVFHWNIYTFGAENKYGITDSGKNEKTIDYIRYCTTRFLETYPQVDGIGVAAGEHFDIRGGEREKWLWRTFGLGIMDYHKKHPDRSIRFIFRSLLSNADSILEAFKDYDAGPFHTDHKYARARVHSTTTSPYMDFEYRDGLESIKVPCWLNLRNDDLFVLRWGDPDYVREFMANVPRDLMRSEAGYFLGPDGFVQGREFVHKDADLSGQLEVDKHWYRFMMFGRLGYDLTLTREFFEQRLSDRFPEADSRLLYDTWKSSSQIIPQVNRFFFRINDSMFSPEGCISSGGFLTVDHSFFRFGPLEGSGILSVHEFADAVLAGKPFDGITPLEVADCLDQSATRTLRGVAALREQSVPSQKEFLSTLSDLEAMALLGRYYASKIRGAAELAVYRADPERRANHQRAVKHFNQAISDWEAYARSATGQYNSQLFSRTHYLDWWKILEDVKKEARSVEAEEASPKRSTNRNTVPSAKGLSK
ncbi:hypothetical protein [Novipirellula artificiosorum]|uniref:Carbohydrate-binding family 6 protein n=1 Tax=Novipirellula artificiosorum TaxID=2528016 RepID=A0A5C6D627_9BACT|nr:hypothetical protein [Novipirellula artificiosorum]TWU31201.1 hypothetical protein Poly41_63920 [Novipirellula artificiosorum]